MIKKIITISAIALVAFSCKPELKGIEKLKEEKANFEKQIKTYTDSLKEVKLAIKALDTNKVEGLKIRTALVEQKPFSEIVKFQGTVKADKNVLVSPQSSGVIKGIFVKEGQRVSRGKTLASLDSDILSQSIKEVEKGLELATYMFDKQVKLKAQGVGTELQYEQAKNQKESLERKLATLSTQTSKSRIVSPISGYVDKILPNVGELASPQMPMFRVMNLSKVRVSADISENYLKDIKRGNTVSVYFPSIDYRLDNLKVTSTGKYINPANRTFSVQIDIHNKDGIIIPNLLAEVSITKSHNKNAILVPSKSILEDNKGQKYIFINENNRATKRNIIVDFVAGEITQISAESGIKKDMQIITDGCSVLLDGDLVEVME